MPSGLPTRFPQRSSTTLVTGDTADATPHGFAPYLYTPPAEGDEDPVTVLRIVRGLVRSTPTTGTGDDADYDLGDVQDYFVKVTYDADGNPTAAEIVVAAEDEIPDDDTTHAHQFLFRVDEAGSVLIKDVWSSLGFRLCGGTADFWGLRGGA